MVVGRVEGAGHGGRREGRTEDEVDDGAVILLLVRLLGVLFGGLCECLRRAGDSIVDCLCGVGLKVVG